MSICGKSGYVTIEFPDGTFFSGNVLVASIETTSGFDVDQWSLGLVGTGNLITNSEAREIVAVQKNKGEWQCVYCGRIHAYTETYCKGGCLAPRPLMYGE